MVTQPPNSKMKVARYLSVVLILALAAAGSVWLRSTLMDVEFTPAASEHGDTNETAPASEPEVVEATPSSKEAVGPQPRLQWRTVDGGTQLVQSESARERWEDERKRIYEGLRAQKETLAANTFDAGAGGPKPGTLGKEYIQGAIAELKPLFKECYDLALHDDDKVEGKIVVAFTIAADGHGGIVESAEIAEGASAKHSGLRECMRETIYTLDLPAPENGGVIHVRYPFEFTKP